MKIFKVLSIDAWGNENDGYEWNNWFNAGEYSENEYGLLTENSALEFFKIEYINKGYENQFEIQDDQYNLILIEKSTQKPIYAIEYGSQY